MRIRLEGGLPHVETRLTYRGLEVSLEQVILDTGSAGCVFAADEVARLGLLPEPMDPIRRIRGVGGSEFVYSKRLDSLQLGEMEVRLFEVQVGALDYGFPLQGILGTDFLRQAEAVIDLKNLVVRRAGL